MKQRWWVVVAVLAACMMGGLEAYAKKGGHGGGGSGGGAAVARVALTGWRVKGGGLTGLPSLHVVDGDGSGLTRLTTADQWENPDWAPDGRFIAARVDNTTGVYEVATGSVTTLGVSANWVSWSRRLDGQGAVLPAEQQYLAGSWNSNGASLRVVRPFGPSGPDSDVLLNAPAGYDIEQVEWVPQHAAASDTSVILYRLAANRNDAFTGTVMAVEVDTSSWPIQVVSGPSVATWAETPYPPSFSADGTAAVWTAADQSALRLAAVQWNAATGDLLGLGTPSSFGASVFSAYDAVGAAGASLDSTGARAAVWAALPSGHDEMIMLDVDGSNDASVGPGTKRYGIDRYRLKTSWEPLSGN